jgi:hypothetical protein
MNTLPEDASTPPTPRHQRSSSPTKLTYQQPSTYPRNIKSHVSSRLLKVKFLLAIVAPISVQIIVERIELLTARQTILTITIIVDSLRHITKRSTTIKNNLIVILPPKQVSRLFSSLSDRTSGAEENGSGSEGAYVVANHKLRICSVGQRCTNARSSREVA